ncbi:hypothetical protein JKP88DRAFT_261116 [Tribonema minus]|uniref:Uncharacterized protein n=1 Tax=Tribonema minus TaxID=303371 RepID=A0A835Z2T5_9STRA|nr:hypothetical protein JKP88DRAFT_261116 [Tribonema minus]
MRSEPMLLVVLLAVGLPMRIGAPPVPPKKMPAAQREATAVDFGPTDFCKQPTPPPGVKPGSCFQVVCLPTSIAIGAPFHTRVRWCLQRPRRSHLVVDTLDVNTKEWYGGDGYTPEGEWQCGEHTFEQTMNAVPDPATGEYNVLWRYFVTPVWGDGRYDIREEEPYPNAIAATGIDRQPLYDGLVDDCGLRPDRLVNFPPTGVQDGIDFPYTPYCIQPGEPFFVAVFTHLLSAPAADLHVNLHIGTGPDKYLGPDDIFVAESVEFGIPRDVDAIWSRHLARFTGRATAMLVGYSTPYLTAFLVPAGSTFDPSIPLRALDSGLVTREGPRRGPRLSLYIENA